MKNLHQHWGETMKRILFAALIVTCALLLPTFAHAETCPGLDRAMRPLAYTQIAVSNTAVGLTRPASGNPRIAVIVVETNSIRYRDDGTVPTATVGMPIAANNSVIVCANAIFAFKAIRQSADAVLNVSIYGD